MFRLGLVLSACFLTLVTARADDTLTVAHHLAAEGLKYTYGSDDLRCGGLDCSAFVRVVFAQALHLDLPDQADKQLDYIRRHGGMVWDANAGWTTATLQPGDLVFYAGPSFSPRISLISHVMLYAGNNQIVGAQGKGHQLNGTRGGVGYYRFHGTPPMGHLDSAGLEFLGHRRIFAYARFPSSPGPIPVPALLAEKPHVLPLTNAPRTRMLNVD